MTDTITLPVGHHTRTYDRDRLATAVIVYLDLTRGNTPCPNDTIDTSHVLRDDHDFGAESIAYAVAARICIEHNIEP
jgi:hypothetical protein